MLDLLLTFIYVAIYIAILSVVENPTIKRIKESTDIREILRYRKRLNRIRKTSLVVYYCCISLPWLILAYLEYQGEIEELGIFFYLVIFIYSFAGSYLWIRRRSHHNPLGSTYDLSGEDVLESKKPYVLFLRSFEKDDYTPEVFIRKRTKAFPCFSEYHFTKLFHRYRNTYAVGMTKEIEAPCGAKRVYLSDAEWQQDVRALMERASYIIILVDARPSCLWEIEQSAAMLRKTIFIADDVTTYTEAQQKLNDTLPALDAERKTPLALYSADGEHFSVIPFEHTLRSYRKLVKQLATGHCGLKARWMPLRRLGDNRFFAFLLVWIASCFMSALSEGMHYDMYNEPLAEDVSSFNALWLTILYYGVFTKTFRESVQFFCRLIRWVLLVAASFACAEPFADAAGEYHVLVRVSGFALFLTLFALFYHKCLLRWVERLRAARPRRREG